MATTTAFATASAQGLKREVLEASSVVVGQVWRISGTRLEGRILDLRELSS